RLTNPGNWLLAVAIAVAPWVEEISIAYDFGQLCRKDAGRFIHKTVEVDGFYDDTTHWWRQLTDESQYQFVESSDQSNNSLWRVERVGQQIRHFRIDKTTARYEYKQTHLHTPVAYKITKIEGIVVDRERSELLGRSTTYTRDAHWFF